MKPMANWYADAAGYRKLGLRYAFSHSDNQLKRTLMRSGTYSSIAVLVEMKGDGTSTLAGVIDGLTLPSSDANLSVSYADPMT
jgi:hypothetical protein